MMQFYGLTKGGVLFKRFKEHLYFEVKGKVCMSRRSRGHLLIVRQGLAIYHYDLFVAVEATGYEACYGDPNSESTHGQTAICRLFTVLHPPHRRARVPVAPGLVCLHCRGPTHTDRDVRHAPNAAHHSPQLPAARQPALPAGEHPARDSAVLHRAQHQRAPIQS